MPKVDELSPASRAFYEQTRLKVAASLIIASVGLTLMGFCAQDGGKAEYYKTAYTAAKARGASTNVQTALLQTSGGFGFACFVFLIAAMLTLALAVVVSPVCGFGTPLEVSVSPLSTPEATVFMWPLRSPYHLAHPTMLHVLYMCTCAIILSHRAHGRPQL